MGVKILFGLVGVQGELGLVDKLLVLRFLHEAHEALALRLAKPGLVEQQAKFHLQFVGVLGAILGQQLFAEFLCIGQIAGDELVLGLNEVFDLVIGLAILLVEAGRRRAADDQRRARLVDEDRVHLINDGEVVLALHLVLGAAGHAVVTQVVEAKLRVGAVGDVAVVLLAALGRVHVVHDTADTQPEIFVDRAHPFAIALGEVVVDGHKVHAAPGQCVEVNRQCGDECLALAGGHLGDVALVQRHAADELYVVRDHLPSEVVAAHVYVGAVKPSAGIFHHRKRLRQDGRQLLLQLPFILDGCETFLPLLRLLAQGVRRGGLQLLLEPVDLPHACLELIDQALVFIRKKFTQKTHHHFLTKAVDATACPLARQRFPLAKRLAKREGVFVGMPSGLP